jgi:adenylate cyclase
MSKYKLYSFLFSFAVLLGLVALRVSDPFFIETARLKTIDYYQRTQPKQISENIVVVEIDEKTLDKEGQWPFPRQTIAKAIKKAFDNQAQLVVLPIIFAEKDRFNGDDELTEALKTYPVILSQSAANKGKGQPVPRGVATIGENINDWLFEYNAAIGPTKQLGEAAAGVGMLLTAPEVDGVVRRLPLIVQINKELYPTIPLEMLRVLAGDPSYQARINEAGVDAVRIPQFKTIKTDEHGRVWINFKYEFASLSFADGDWSKVKDKVVMLAPTAEGLSNTVATSVNIRYGYEIPLFVAQMVADDARLERPSQFNLYELLYGSLAGLAVILMLISGPYWLAGIFYAVLVAAPVKFGFMSFAKGQLFDYSWIIITVSVLFMISAFLRFISEFKQKQLIKKQFGTYLAPALVEKLQKNPGLLRLGGDERELSIMFTDVRGFTTISEHYGKNVQGLTMIMNRYMTAMTESILKNDGTLDKYIGDAQMAFWNAPLDDTNHAKNAVKTALEMLKRLDSFNEEISKEGVPPFGMGLGINTGSVVVGNMGSTQRFDYTCLGDHVNLASRLEGQSKPYGVRIIIGPRTAEHIKNDYQTLELDLIAVKGKKEGVKIFTVLENSMDEDKIKHIYRMHDGFLCDYRAQKWDNAIALAESLQKNNPELKKYYSMMIERIAELREKGLTKDWNGVYVATSK